MPTFADLAQIVHQPGPTTTRPTWCASCRELQRIGEPGIPQRHHGDGAVQPVIDFLRPYTPDLVGWFRDFGQSAANYDANGHYARVEPMFGAFQYQDTPAAAANRSPTRRSGSTGLTSGFTRRCPGAASQPRGRRLQPVRAGFRDTTARAPRP